MQNKDMNKNDVINEMLNEKLDLLRPHASHLAWMRRQNQSTSEILAWLHTRNIYHIYESDLAAFWLHGEKRQAQALANPPLPPTPNRVGGATVSGAHTVTDCKSGKARSVPIRAIRGENLPKSSDCPVATQRVKSAQSHRNPNPP